MTKYIATAILALSVSSAYAQKALSWDTAGDFYRDCHKTANPIDPASDKSVSPQDIACMSFVAGLKIGLMEGRTSGAYDAHLKTYTAMKLDGFQLFAVLRVVDKYLDAHPEVWSEPISCIAEDAIFIAYGTETETTAYGRAQ